MVWSTNSDCSSKSTVKSVVVPLKLVMASPGTMRVWVRSVEVPEKLVILSPGKMTVPVKSVVVLETCLMSMVPVAMVAPWKDTPPAITAPASPSISSTEDAPAESIVQVVEPISMVEDTV